MSFTLPPPSASPLRARNIVIVAALVGLGLLWLGVAKRDVLFGKRERAEAPAEPEPVETAAAPQDELAERWARWLGHPPRWPERLAEPSCAEIAGELDALCRGLGEASAVEDPCAVLRTAAVDLAQQPPEVAMQLREPAALAAGVFHVFRVLGAERLGTLRDLLEDEALVEPAAFVLYRWWMSRAACDQDPALAAVDHEAFHDYAVFAFGSLGGQAYLRRRAPRVEALACFYGLHGFDVAAERGHNPHGFDPTPEIRRCRALLDTQKLDLREHYVAELGAIATRWAAKSRLSPARVSD